MARADGYPIGFARLVREPDTTAADVAVAVADPWQRRGAGIALARRLASEAAAAGVAHVHALIAADNSASLTLMRVTTTVVEIRFEGSDLYVVGRIPAGVPPSSLRLPSEHETSLIGKPAEVAGS